MGDKIPGAPIFDTGVLDDGQNGLDRVGGSDGSLEVRRVALELPHQGSTAAIYSGVTETKKREKSQPGCYAI
jgi:hypothetical protein